jgi:hypothetical protein
MDNEDDNVCSLVGNDYLYGLGIRLGIYCSLLATPYAKYFLPTALKDTMATNAVFIFTITIAMIKNAASGELATVEGFFMLQILFGYILCGIDAGSTSLWFASIFMRDLSAADHELVRAHIGQTELTTNIINVLRSANVSLGLWFWFAGAGGLLDGYLPCAFQVFFSHRFDGYGPIQTLLKVLATSYVFFQFLWYASSIGFSIRGLRNAVKSPNQHRDLRALDAKINQTGHRRLVARTWNHKKEQQQPASYWAIFW